jgi:hypothetical protein
LHCLPYGSLDCSPEVEYGNACIYLAITRGRRVSFYGVFGPFRAPLSLSLSLLSQKSALDA